MGRKGFTLLELLVVIAVLALVTALLLAIFARTREQSRRSACSNNLHQLVTAANYYTCQFSNGEFPNYNNEALKSMNLLFGPKLKDHRVFACPSSRSPAPPETSEIKAFKGSNFADLNMTSSMTHYGYTLGKNPSMSACGVFGDALGGTPGGRAENNPSNHAGAGVMLALGGGSVEWFDVPKCGWDDFFRKDVRAGDADDDVDTFLQMN